MAKTKVKTVLAVIGTDGVLIGYYKDMTDVEKSLKGDDVEEAIILEVVSVTEAYSPPEPEFQYSKRLLSSLL